MKKYIVAHCSGGICNRLKCLITAMRYAETFSKGLILYWPENSLLSCKFSDLFDNNFAEVDTQQFQSIYDTGENGKYQILGTWRLLVLPEDNLPKNFSRAFPSDGGQNIDFEYDRIPINIRRNFLKYLTKLSVKKEIIDIVKEVSSMFDSNDVSVSVRSWEEYPPRHDLFDLRNVYKALDGARARKFFVSCDSMEILNSIIEKYGEKIITYPEATLRSSGKAIRCPRDLLCDLLLLAKNKKLFVSYLSTFSEMAWWFSGCEAEIMMIKPKTFLFKKVQIETKETAICVLGKWYIFFRKN